MLTVMIFLFIIGLVIGSFLNVAIYRTVKGESPLRGRSYCDDCHKKIAWYDNIPLLSFLLLRGRCRYCRGQISFTYPLVELLTGGLFVWWFLAGSFFFRLSQQPLMAVQAFFWLVVGCLLLVIFFADAIYGIIPDSASLGLLVTTFGYRLILYLAKVMVPVDFVYYLLTAMTSYLFFHGLWWLTRRKGIGYGDVKLALALGLLLGWPRALVGFFLSFIIGSIYGLVMIQLRRKTIKQAIYFGPFLVLGSLLALLWGNQIWGWYLKVAGLV